MVFAGSHQAFTSGISLDVRLANERCRYIVTTCLIGWAYTKTDPWLHDLMFTYKAHVNTAHGNVLGNVIVVNDKKYIYFFSKWQSHFPGTNELT